MLELGGRVPSLHLTGRHSTKPASEVLSRNPLREHLHPPPYWRVTPSLFSPPQPSCLPYISLSLPPFFLSLLPSSSLSPSLPRCLFLSLSLTHLSHPWNILTPPSLNSSLSVYLTLCLTASPSPPPPPLRICYLVGAVVCGSRLYQKGVILATFCPFQPKHHFTSSREAFCRVFCTFLYPNAVPFCIFEKIFYNWLFNTWTFIDVLIWDVIKIEVLNHQSNWCAFMMDGRTIWLQYFVF